jgi:hypothetical protein
VADLSGLFAPMLSREGELDLLIGFTVLFRQFFLDGWLAEHRGRPDGKGGLREYEGAVPNGSPDHQKVASNCEYPGGSPDHQKIASLCDGSGGYYAELSRLAK